MNLLLLFDELRAMLQPKKPVQRHLVGPNSADLEEPFWNYHLRDAEPVDATFNNPWAIE